MSRILDFLGKYDEKLTISQLKECIENDRIKNEEDEIKQIEKVKIIFENYYCKEICNETMFGKTLNVYHLKGYTRSEKDTSWENIYYFNGNKISFSKYDINKIDFDPYRVGFGFYYDELMGMEVISREEYLNYEEEYNKISNKLLNLINETY